MLTKKHLTDVQYQVPVLETERLRLREFRLSDFESYAQWMSDPNFRRFLGKGELLNREMAWRAFCGMIGHWVLRGFGFWALEHKQTGDYVGHVGIHYPEDWPDIEIGWGLDPKQQGQGYAFEAAEKAMQFGFESLQLEALISLIVRGNQPSVNLAQKLGEKHHKVIEMMGRKVDIFRITADEYGEMVKNERLTS
ncbi:GNAT family N-acetyltransferase [Kangiella sp. TOML190]|uniref:GNAT family N-acetyltransferase n=1 Tax=Kangiella sp. TOML190 TaxID=2931351 RepID=UPI00203D9EF9|nr:GNAT family N-acetyltransferase [Kangiella sp. TOML190]